MIFKIGDRELNFDEKTKIVTYKTKIFTPVVRTYSDMKEIFNSKTNLPDDFGLYFMYRDVYFDDIDKEKLLKNNLRYDLTILSPIKIGEEKNKTFGHFHPKKDDGNYFMEVYEILYGEAIYLQQNNDKSFYTKAFLGDKILMEQGFGHITINNSDENYLIMVNLVDDSFSSIYSDYKEKKGGAYYFINNKFELNKNYKEIEIKESIKKLDGINIYDDFLLNEEKFNYLH